MKRHASTLLLIVCALLLVAAVFRLFTLRFETGDVYPEYSSLRADPLGTMAFYESLDNLPGLTVSRDFSTTNRLPSGRETTYLHLAGSSAALDSMPDSTFSEIERFVSDGGRLVITFYPLFEAPRSVNDSAAKKDVKIPAYRSRWGIRYAYAELERVQDSFVPAFARNVSGLALPDLLAWHTAMTFTELPAEWRPIYERDGKPVVVERSFGRGAVVLATDSFLVSNEAMLLDRQAAFLSFLVGNNRRVVFDEAHLGVTESPGLATLLRRYRLYWAGAGLLLAAALFVWKMSVPFVPARAAEREQAYVAGKDAAEGMINLLRRSIPPARLLQTCFEHWRNSAAKSGGYSAERIRRAESAFAAHKSAAADDQRIVEAYRTISTTLQKRTHEH